LIKPADEITLLLSGIACVTSHEHDPANAKIYPSVVQA